MANGHEEGLKNQDQYVETTSGILVTSSGPYSDDARISVMAYGHHHYDAGKKGEKENNKDLFFLKNGNTKESLSLHKIHVVPFLEVVVEEMMNRWVRKELKTFNEEARRESWLSTGNKKLPDQDQLNRTNVDIP
nr:hypothetical protein [Tanacetum cinerariifolium]GEZ48018.1 hypothetical protein [Tanacetum cinerariifolium]